MRTDSGVLWDDRMSVSGERMELEHAKMAEREKEQTFCFVRLVPSVNEVSGKVQQ